MKQYVLVKICGDCNPQINIRSLIKQLKIASDRYDFLTNSNMTCKLMLIINGCMSDCVSTPEFDGRIVTVSGSRIDYKDVKEEGMAKEIIKLLDENTDRLANDLY